MVFETQELYPNAPRFISKVDEVKNLYTKSLSQIGKSCPVFASVIFLAIFQDMKAVDAKAMRN